jgi:hypothetical protein
VLIATTGGGRAGLDDYRTALLVPLVAALVAVAVSMIRRRPGAVCSC